MEHLNLVYFSQIEQLQQTGCQYIPILNHLVNSNAQAQHIVNQLNSY